MWILYLTLGIIGGLLVLLFIILFGFYLYIYYTPRKWQNNDFYLTKRTKEFCDLEIVNFLIDRARKQSYEDAYTSSFDNLKLHALIHRNEKSDTVAIMFHGYRGTPCRDFSGGAYDMISYGFNVILAEHRGHGKSQGHTITFGIKERRDVISWIEYAKKEFGEDKRIILVGISMGGASVLFASDSLKENDLIICDCPFASPREILLSSVEKLSKTFAKLLLFFLNASLIVFAHVSLNKESADKHIKNCKAKILIIHGDEDTVVPYQQSYQLYFLNQDKIKYELFPGAEHGLCYLVDQAKRKGELITFLIDLINGFRCQTIVIIKQRFNIVIRG